MASKKTPEEFWRSHLTEHQAAKIERMILQRLPSEPRCKLCHAPFGPPSSHLMRYLGHPQSRANPHVCDMCERYLKDYVGGAEIEISMVFADVRGSTTLAEGMSASAFSNLMRRFYTESSKALVDANAMVYTTAGDQMIGYFFPAFAGKRHPSVAINAGLDILRATGHADLDGPWVPVGAGVHTGIAFCGAVEKAEGIFDYVVLGDSVNVAARLSSAAAAGQLLISDAAATAAGYSTDSLERRELSLRGRHEPVVVWVKQVDSIQPAVA